MQIHLEKPNQNAIQSYSETGVVVDNIHYEKSVILSPDTIITTWPIQNLMDLNETLIQPLLELKPDLILIGHKNTQYQLDPALMLNIINQQIGVDCMSIGAACRTFNVLLSEHRSVVLGLIF